LNDDSDHFETAVRGVDGTWPTAPGFWSYSSLGAAEDCPRRWMLSRADYGDLWEGHGYPPRPVLAALTGTVVHRCLEVLLTALRAQGCSSIADPTAVEATRSLGGYSRLVESVITEELAALKGNPRAVDLKPAFVRQLTKEVPRIRERVQMAISRARLVPGGEDSEKDSDGTGETGITRGSHTEVELRDDGLKLLGRADLITVSETGGTITDYKTGEPSEGHSDQVRLYGLLWSRDGRVNPGQIPIERLVVSYATHDKQVDAPSSSELADLATQITSRIAATEERLALRPPPAHPDKEICRFCDVRHLCDDYWSTVCPTLGIGQGDSAAGIVDCEGEIAQRNGPLSWVLRLKGEPDSALLRTTDERPGFEVGDHVRLLGVVAGTVEAEGSSQVALTMTAFSELFLLDPV
jgi:RecB family exonuclease